MITSEITQSQGRRLDFCDLQVVLARRRPRKLLSPLWYFDSSGDSKMSQNEWDFCELFAVFRTSMFLVYF